MCNPAIRDKYMNLVRRKSCRGISAAIEEIQNTMKVFPNTARSEVFYQNMVKALNEKSNWGAKQLEQLFDKQTAALSKD